MKHGRRTFIGAALAAPLFGCGDGDDVSKRGMPPWHMWGSTVAVNYLTTLGAGRPQVAQQLLRVDYGRPDTWTFFLAAVLASDWTGLGGSFIDIFWDVSIGLGRGAIKLATFDQFRFENTGTPPVQGSQIFVTSAAGPVRVPGATETNHIEYFPAQSINITARVQGGIGSGATVAAQLDLTAFVAPRSHIRPEWFSSKPDDFTRYPGGENGGS